VRGRGGLNVCWFAVRTGHTLLRQFQKSFFEGTICRKIPNCPIGGFATKGSGKGEMTGSRFRLLRSSALAARFGAPTMTLEMRALSDHIGGRGVKISTDLGSRTALGITYGFFSARRTFDLFPGNQRIQTSERGFPESNQWDSAQPGAIDGYYFSAVVPRPHRQKKRREIHPWGVGMEACHDN
jgi:hypothetical protein